MVSEAEIKGDERVLYLNESIPYYLEDRINKILVKGDWRVACVEMNESRRKYHAVLVKQRCIRVEN